MFFKRVASFSPRIGSLAKYGTEGASPVVPKEVAKESCKSKQPFKVSLEAGKKYSWCSCGHAKTALCDGTHKDKTLNIKESDIQVLTLK
ncbi:hypothetical protein ABMA27_012150 [Loxostege sticticalis]|uniref:Iron-binding zinc finger CDGSH type domain-containing protein n=1 Tax=Loxostege sticticalis TaxID=481309 RepID=A0ABR3IIV0_LOXSC